MSDTAQINRIARDVNNILAGRNAQLRVGTYVSSFPMSTDQNVVEFNIFGKDGKLVATLDGDEYKMLMTNGLKTVLGCDYFFVCPKGSQTGYIFIKAFPAEK